MAGSAVTARHSVVCPCSYSYEGSMLISPCHTRFCGKYCKAATRGLIFAAILNCLNGGNTAGKVPEP